MSSSSSPTATPVADPRALKLVDADVHSAMPLGTMLERMSAPARRHFERFGFRTPSPAQVYPRVAHGGMRVDSWPSDPRAIPGSDPELMGRQLLDEYGIDYAILNTLNLQECYETPELAAELARTINDWLWEEFLDVDPRLRGSIVVPHEYPELAVREIERCAADERWVQVLMPIQSQNQLGLPRFWPIYEAAAALGRPVAFHSGGYGAHPGTGWPSYYLEEHVSFSMAMQGLLTSMVCNGLFEALPDLRVVLTEGGVAWVTSLRAALDDAWALLGDDAPDLKRRPSEYVAEHVWFTTQPIEEPDDPEQLVTLLRHARLSERLLFASDYPHWDFDSPSQALPRALAPEQRQRIFATNAGELYGLTPAG